MFLFIDTFTFRVFLCHMPRFYKTLIALHFYMILIWILRNNVYAHKIFLKVTIFVSQWESFVFYGICSELDPLWSCVDTSCDAMDSHRKWTRKGHHGHSLGWNSKDQPWELDTFWGDEDPFILCFSFIFFHIFRLLVFFVKQDLLAIVTSV